MIRLFRKIRNRLLSEKSYGIYNLHALHESVRIQALELSSRLKKELEFRSSN